MQWPHYHNTCWYHGFTPPPISARHFHHLLGTEFHHSRHSCPPSLPSLLLFLVLHHNQVCPDSFATVVFPRPRTAQPPLCGPPICVCTFIIIIIDLFFRVDVTEREDPKVALEGGMCCYTWSGDWQTWFVFMNRVSFGRNVERVVRTGLRVNFNWRYEASRCQEILFGCGTCCQVCVTCSTFYRN